MLIVVLAQVGFGRVDLLFQIVEIENSVFELHLGVLAFILICGFRRADDDSRTYQRRQFLAQNFFFDLFFKFRHRNMEVVVDLALISIFANEYSIGKESLTILSVLEVIGQLSVTDFKTYAVSFLPQASAGDQLRGRAGAKERRILLCITATLNARLRDLQGFPVDLFDGNLFVANLGVYVGALGVTEIGNTGDHEDDHRKANNAKEYDHQAALGRVVFLQKANHGIQLLRQELAETNIIVQA